MIPCDAVCRKSGVVQLRALRSVVLFKLDNIFNVQLTAVCEVSGITEQKMSLAPVQVSFSDRLAELLLHTVTVVSGLTGKASGF